MAIPQVMSMQRTTCCLLLRLSHATLPGKTNISGCCSSEARSCARWEWYIAIVMLLKHTVPERIHVVSHLGRRAYHLCTVFMLSVPRELALFSLPPLSGSHIWVSSMIASAAEQRFTVEWRAYPEFRFFFFIYHQYSIIISQVCISLNFAKVKTYEKVDLLSMHHVSKLKLKCSQCYLTLKILICWVTWWAGQHLNNIFLFSTVLYVVALKIHIILSPM